jgi:hypothetical protein
MTIVFFRQNSSAQTLARQINIDLNRVKNSLDTYTMRIPGRTTVIQVKYIEEKNVTPSKIIFKFVLR